MKNSKHILKIVMLIFSAMAFAQEVQLKVDEGKLSWTGKAAFNSYALSGYLKLEEGYANINQDTILSLKMVIDMKSLDHSNSDLKKHLRSEDFFEVNTYKTAIFEITKPAIIKNNQAVLVGNMTIKNITKEETIAISVIEKSIIFNHKMNRTVYGITYNSPSFFKKMKENAIADNFEIKGKITFK